ncbi:CBS domain-containing protein [Rhizosphaericola mali]|uniref:CBS domain-containing protein n=1 Tax=Rhizosphaericola mali TaxID=2545455 RepID=A0A5P2G5M6_9BACT|nr:CBS domain-containing protein [Rhizosphaericola mali]QES89988.1 CBS domain-containing protein [Rhizosphaericola mali]
MLCQQAIETQYPFIENNASIASILELMDQTHIYTIPVLENDVLLGIITRTQLQDATEVSIHLDNAHQPLQIMENEHICSALRVMLANHLQILPVHNSDNKYQGIITTETLLQKISLMIGCDDAPGALITLEMDRHNFSFGELSRLVETNDAGIMQLNTYTEPETGYLIVNIRINKAEVSDVVATLQRYDYVVRYFFGKENYENELKQNYDALMNYLNI